MYKQSDPHKHNAQTPKSIYYFPTTYVGRSFDHHQVEVTST